MVSTRNKAMLRKRAIIDGTYGTFQPYVGGWDPAWDSYKRVTMARPYKGHARERTRPERADRITRAMEAMPDRLAKYAQEAKDRKPPKTISSIFKRVEKLAMRKARKR